MDSVDSGPHGCYVKVTFIQPTYQWLLLNTAVFLCSATRRGSGAADRTAISWIWTQNVFMHRSPLLSPHFQSPPLQHPWLTFFIVTGLHHPFPVTPQCLCPLHSIPLYNKLSCWPISRAKLQTFPFFLLNTFSLYPFWTLFTHLNQWYLLFFCLFMLIGSFLSSGCSKWSIHC